MLPTNILIGIAIGIVLRRRPSASLLVALVVGVTFVVAFTFSDDEAVAITVPGLVADFFLNYVNLAIGIGVVLTIQHLLGSRRHKRLRS